MHDTRIAWACKLIDAGCPESVAEEAAAKVEWMDAIKALRYGWGIDLMTARAVIVKCIGEGAAFRRQSEIEGTEQLGLKEA